MIGKSGREVRAIVRLSSPEAHTIQVNDNGTTLRLIKKKRDITFSGSDSDLRKKDLIELHDSLDVIYILAKVKSFRKFKRRTDFVEIGFNVIQ